MGTKTILILNLMLLPAIAIAVGVSLYMEVFGNQSTPVSSWVSMVLLAIYAMLKLDLKKIVMEKDENK